MEISSGIQTCRKVPNNVTSTADIAPGFISISCPTLNGLIDTRKASIPAPTPIDLPPAFNIENAARIRKETGMITVGVGRINTAALAEKILEEDKVD
ncbi:MAG: hypothetical protein IJO13_07300, partial [Lachnospiraceae bacterium]|nr:hypothetical protein [Lachnospiraceae bacterium]